MGRFVTRDNGVMKTSNGDGKYFDEDGTLCYDGQWKTYAERVR